MRRVELDARLSSAAKMVRQGAVFADIGTDHAYLPVFLLEEKRIQRAYAADIALGPLKHAEETLRQYGFTEQVTLLHTPGLSGMDNLGLTDIAICGMGGETVVSILHEAPFIKTPGIRLVLQPMTRVNILRQYLAENGFSVLQETVSEAADKLYFCLLAEYTGTPYPLERCEAELGKYLLAHPTPPFCRMVAKKEEAMRKKLEGMEKGGICDPEEIAYGKFLTEWRKEHDSK